MLFYINRIQSESRSRERSNAEQQKRSHSYGDALNNGSGGNNNNGSGGNRRQLPMAPSTTTKLQHLSSDIHATTTAGMNGDLSMREPTPDYDTTSMASTVINMADVSKLAHPSNQAINTRRNSADSTGSGNSSGKRRVTGVATSSGATVKQPRSNTAAEVFAGKSKEKLKNADGKGRQSAFLIFHLLDVY